MPTSGRIQRAVGPLVRIGGRFDHAAVGDPGPEDPAVTQAGHEAGEDGTQGAGVVELDPEGGAEGAGHGQK